MRRPGRGDSPRCGASTSRAEPAEPAVLARGGGVTAVFVLEGDVVAAVTGGCCDGPHAQTAANARNADTYENEVIGNRRERSTPHSTSRCVRHCIGGSGVVRT